MIEDEDDGYILNEDIIKMTRLFCLICGKEGSLENDVPCCGYSMENVEPEILESLIILNKKGWKTIWSCAGHEGEDFNGMRGPWVSFDFMENTPPEEAPLGFEWRPYPSLSTPNSLIKKPAGWDWPTLARSSFHFLDQVPLEDFRNSLLDWCKELPNNNLT